MINSSLKRNFMFLKQQSKKLPNDSTGSFAAEIMVYFNATLSEIMYNKKIYLNLQFRSKYVSFSNIRTYIRQFPECSNLQAAQQQINSFPAVKLRKLRSSPRRA